MSLRVYNTLSRRKEVFEPVEPGRVGIYLCGPTVYKPSHIGHAVGPIIFDAIKRYLVYKGYKVRLVINITDVDDKIIAEAAEQGRPMAEIAAEVEADYLKCLDALGVTGVDAFPRATENIDRIIVLVQRLIDNGAAYAVASDVYFDHTAAADYGKLSGRRVEDAMHGTRDLAGENKRHPADFAVWKGAAEGEPAWDSPWGRGRPGWHIECSAMSMALLGETFDIHGGGVDLIFPHHENEIAQSEAATGKTFAKYWLHNGLTRVKTKAAAGSEKMSKSLGNIRTITDLLEEFPPETIRAFVLSTHYRRPLEFSDEQLKATASSLDGFYILFNHIKFVANEDVYEEGKDITEVANEAKTKTDDAFVKEVLEHRLRFHEAMDDDFNTARAIAVLHEITGALQKFMLEESVYPREPGCENVLVAPAGRTIVKLGRILGLFEKKPDCLVSYQIGLGDAEIERHVAERENARKAKDFARADEIRDWLAKRGVILEDTLGVTIWRKA